MWFATSYHFMTNIKDLVKIAEYKYPHQKITFVLIFNRTAATRHTSKTPSMPAVWTYVRWEMYEWTGHTRKMVNNDGVPKGIDIHGALTKHKWRWMTCGQCYLSMQRKDHSETVYCQQRPPIYLSAQVPLGPSQGVLICTHELYTGEIEIYC